MGTQYDNPQTYVEMIDDIRCTINTIDEVVDGYLDLLGIKKSNKKTANYSAIYNNLIPKDAYKIQECDNFAYGLFVMHEIRNRFSHEERIAHSLDKFKESIDASKEIDEILAEGETHPLLDKNDTELKNNFGKIEKELKAKIAKESIDYLYREHEYWFKQYKDFLQNYYDRQELEADK